ncbi:MAG TPA: APC family permease [Gemmatimonadaceae bacterium]|nr:APC family permease [Gemmatimonadaceae bacterium]
MSIRDLLFGRPLRTEEEQTQRIGPIRGVPLLGLDALASAAYGPEAALTVLLPLGLLSARYIAPLSAVIIVLLGLVSFSYRQTIAAYPNGGGSYTVASTNLGTLAGLIAASALCVDFVLNAAVAISAGVGAIVSAVPALLPYTLPICLVVLAMLTVVNLRGVRESGYVFMIPTYLFVACMGAMLAWGIAKSLASHGHPVPVVSVPHPAPAVQAASAWLLFRAFASGCTAMTGVEAVSNGVPVFKAPTVRLAARTLMLIVGALAVMLAGIAYLSFTFHVAATPPGARGYESVLSQLFAAVAGRGAFYYVGIVAIVSVLCLSANTSFAGFPRLCRVLALDEFLPPEFAHPGRRLVYSAGIVVLAVLAAALLVAFGGITDRLIPLFAVGAFLAFTVSQAGMVVHWRRVGGRRARRSLAVNALGALATGITLVVVIVSKFVDGAWITVLLIAALVGVFRAIRRNYDRVDEQTDVEGPLQLGEPPPPVVLVPLKRLDRVARKSLRLAITMSPDVRVIHVLTGEHDMDDLRGRWSQFVERPLRAAGFPVPTLVPLHSPYREFFDPLLEYIHQLAAEQPRRYIAVLVPELVERRWYHWLLHGHRPTLLKGLLLLRGGPRVIVINAPWYLRDDDDEDHTASPSVRVVR